MLSAARASPGQALRLATRTHVRSYAELVTPREPAEAAPLASTAASSSTRRPRVTTPAPRRETVAGAGVKDVEQTSSQKSQDSLRPHLNVDVNPNHGLYAFFRKKGDVYETVEPTGEGGAGRSWRAAELRLKSFKDLHMLWYVLLRERNLLETQLEEGRRMGVQSRNALDAAIKTIKVRKSMARIKYTLNERRIAYEEALELHETHREEVIDRAAEPIRQRVRRIERLKVNIQLLEKRVAEGEAQLKKTSRKPKSSSSKVI